MRQVLWLPCFEDEEAVACLRLPQSHTIHSGLGRDLKPGQSKSCTLSYYCPAPISTESDPLVLHVDEMLSEWQSLLQFPQSCWVTGRRCKKRESWVGNGMDMGHSRFKVQTSFWRCSEDIKYARQKPQSSQGSHGHYLHGGESGSVGLGEVGSEWGIGNRTNWQVLEGAWSQIEEGE